MIYSYMYSLTTEYIKSNRIVTTEYLQRTFNRTVVTVDVCRVEDILKYGITLCPI